MKHIEFYGNRSFSTKELKEVIRMVEGEPYDEFQAALDKRGLTNFYLNNGFKEVQIAWKRSIVDFEKKWVQCEIHISEGPRTYIEHIEFEGNLAFGAERLSHVSGLSPGNPLEASRIFGAKCKLVTHYANKGYPYTQVEHTIIQIDTNRVAVCFKLTEHKLANFGAIKIKGNKAIRSTIIKREITFKPGDTYSPEPLRESQARIYGLDLFESVKFELHGVKEMKDTLPVTFLVTEKPPRWASFGSGYGAPSRIYINLGWGHDNWLGNGQRVGLYTKYELNPFNLKELQTGELSISYLEPYFLNTQFKAELKPFYKLHKVDKSPGYRLTYMGVEGRLGRYVGKYGQSFVSYSYEIIQKEGSVPQQEVGGLVNSILLSCAWDTRDNVFYPRRGGISALSYEYAGGLIGGDYRFKKFVLDFSLHNPFLKTVIGARLKFGGITGEAPLERKFILGGANIVRGYTDMLYEATPEWNNWIGMANLELRAPVFKKFELAYFVDCGNSWTKPEEIGTKDMKLGAGFGIRYYTPIGPIRIDYGRKLIKTGNDKGRVYIAIGYMF